MKDDPSHSLTGPRHPKIFSKNVSGMGHKLRISFSVETFERKTLSAGNILQSSVLPGSYRNYVKCILSPTDGMVVVHPHIFYDLVFNAQRSLSIKLSHCSIGGGRS